MYCNHPPCLLKYVKGGGRLFYCLYIPALAVKNIKASFIYWLRRVFLRSLRVKNKFFSHSLYKTFARLYLSLGFARRYTALAVKNIKASFIFFARLYLSLRANLMK